MDAFNPLFHDIVLLLIGSAITLVVSYITRRQSIDAVRESKAVISFDEMRAALIVLKNEWPKNPCPDFYVPMTIASGAELYIKAIERIGSEVVYLRCSTNQAEWNAANMGKTSPAGWLLIVRISAISSLKPIIDYPALISPPSDEQTRDDAAGK